MMHRVAQGARRETFRVATLPALHDTDKMAKHNKDKKSRSDAIKHALSVGTGTANPKTVARTNERVPAAGAATAAAAAINKAAEAAVTADDEMAVELTRKEEIAELPTMAKTTGMKAATEAVTLFITPLRGSAAEKAFITEETTIKEAHEKAALMVTYIATVLLAASSPVDLVDTTVDGKVSITPLPKRVARGLSGVFVLRLQMHYAMHVSKLLCEAGVSVAWASAIEYDYVAEVDEAAHNASVIEQMRLQGHVDAKAMRDNRQYGEGTLGYIFRFVNEESKKMAFERGHIAILGKYGPIKFRPIEVRPTIESAFVYGLPGAGSAREDFVPEIAGSLGLSTDLIRYKPAQGVLNGIGHVGEVQYHHSKHNHLAAARIFDTGVFRLGVIGAPDLKSAEIYVARSLVELSKMIRMRITRGETDEKEAAITATVPTIEDLSAPTAPIVGMPPRRARLIARYLDDAWRAAGREAAATARARATARERLRPVTAPLLPFTPLPWDYDGTTTADSALRSSDASQASERAETELGGRGDGGQPDGGRGEDGGEHGSEDWQRRHTGDVCTTTRVAIPWARVRAMPRQPPRSLTRAGVRRRRRK